MPSKGPASAPVGKLGARRVILTTVLASAQHCSHSQTAFILTTSLKMYHCPMNTAKEVFLLPFTHNRLKKGHGTSKRLSLNENHGIPTPQQKRGSTHNIENLDIALTLVPWKQRSPVTARRMLAGVPKFFKNFKDSW